MLFKMQLLTIGMLTNVIFLHQIEEQKYRQKYGKDKLAQGPKHHGGGG